MPRLAGVYREFERVRVGERWRFGVAARRRLYDPDIFAAAIGCRERGVEIGSARLPGQRVEMQWHRHQQPLPKMSDRGHKDRPPRQPAIKLRLRHMLVFEAERIKLEGRAGLAVMRFDHLAAATGIAADRVNR